MTGIDIKKAHTLPINEARIRASRALERMKGPMGLDGAWNGNVYQFAKPTKGRLTLAADSVRVEVALATGLHVAKGTIEKRLYAEITYWLGADGLKL